MLAQDLHLHHNNAAMKEIYILNYKLHKICITDFMSHQIWKSSIHKRICWNETRKKKKKKSKNEEININNLALALFMLINMINLQHFYISAKVLKKSWLCYQLQENNTMLWRFKNWVFEKKCNCENASHWLWTMCICKTSSRD